MGDIGKGGETSSDLYICRGCLRSVNHQLFIQLQRERENWFNTDLHSIFCVCFRFNTEGNGYKENFIS